MCSRPSRFGLVRREGERLFVRRLSQQSRCTMSGTIVLSVSVRPDHGGSRWPTDDVRFGSKADISAMLIHVRFTPKSGHWLNASGCPLCARNGLMRCNKIPSLILNRRLSTSLSVKKGWIIGGYFAAAIAICARSSMISAWVPALVRRHPTYSPLRRLAKLTRGLQSRRNPRPRSFMYLRGQTTPVTSCPPICRTRSGTLMTRNSTNCYPW